MPRMRQHEVLWAAPAWVNSKGSTAPPVYGVGRKGGGGRRVPEAARPHGDAEATGNAASGRAGNAALHCRCGAERPRTATSGQATGRGQSPPCRSEGRRSH